MAHVSDTETSCPRLRTATELSRTWNTYAPHLQADPLSGWRALADGGPILWSEQFGGYWLLTRYDDIEWAAKHPEIFSSSDIGIPNRQIYEEKLIPIQLDGMLHRRWRRVLSQLFSPPVVEQLTPAITTAAVTLIDDIAARGSCEFVRDFSVRLPTEVFLINFGIGREHLPWLLEHRDWLRREGLPKAKNDHELQEVGRPLWEFYAEQVAQRRQAADPQATDVISQLQRADFEGRPLTDGEIVNIILMTMFASLDTSNSMLAMIFHHLAGSPAAQVLAATAPERIPGMVEELIRGMPMVSTARVVTEDVERHGVTLRQGDRVLMSWGMAGLDPQVFANPDAIDFDRSHVRHLGFGIGPHRCLGMHLARRIQVVAITEWHRRIPRYRLADPLGVRPRYTPIRESIASNWRFSHEQQHPRLVPGRGRQRLL